MNRPSVETVLVKHSNALHKLLVTCSPHFYVLNDGQLKHQKKRISLRLEDIGTGPKNHIVHYLLVDDYSGAFYAEVCSSRDIVPVEQFLYRAWARKNNHFFCGLPEIIFLPKTLKGLFNMQHMKLFDALHIVPMHPTSGSDAGAPVIRTWEQEILDFYFHPKPSLFAELQRRQIDLCEDANNSLGKSQRWRRNLRRLILPPRQEQFLRYFGSVPNHSSALSSPKKRAGEGKRARKKPALFPPVALGGEIMREELPFPVVYYPNHYGTFFAFSEDVVSQPALCSCSRSAVENLIRLKEKRHEPQNASPLREALLDSWFFPDVIAEVSSTHGPFSLADIPFEKGICHRCNIVSPSLRYCHEMYGTRFIQRYGWYVNQAYLRLGVRPIALDFLSDVCPKEFQEQIEAAWIAGKTFKAKEDRLKQIASGPKRDDMADDEVTYWRNVKPEEAEPMITLRRESARTLRSFTSRIEDIVRQEFGVSKVGERWVSETLLYQLVSRLLANHLILRHHRPEWLKGLELDIFVPHLKLAFEYQGQQHFHAIRAWGGESALQQLIARDALKLRICEQNGIRLITVDYTEPLTADHITGILARNSAAGN